MCQSIMKKMEKENNSQNYIIKKIIKKISMIKSRIVRYCWIQKVTKKSEKYEKIIN